VRGGPWAYLLALALLWASCQERAPEKKPRRSVADWTPDMLVPRARFSPEEIFPHASSPYVFDEQAGLLYEPRRRDVWKEAEHPRGEFVVRSNNLGLLEDGPTLWEKRGLRILVLGDSHLMVVGASESFPNLLEAQLRAAGYPDCEVLNAGIGYTSPALYLRRLEHFARLAPDVVLVSLFTGNDFWEELSLRYDISSSPTPLLDANYRQRLDRARHSFQGPLFQGLNQAYFFKHWPGTEERSFELLLESLQGIRDFCEQRQILFLLMILPTKLDVDEDEPELRAQALSTLELSDEEATVQVRLGGRVLATLREWGVPCLDPTDAMRAEPAPLYWRSDQHLAVRGHAFLAQKLFETFERVLADHGWKKN
jgi:hypothetical protein